MYVLMRKVAPQNEGIARYKSLVLTHSVGRSLRVCRSISSLRWTATRHASFVINNSASRGSWWWCGLRGCWLVGQKTNTGMYEALSGSQSLCSSNILGKAVSTAQVLSSNIVPQYRACQVHCTQDRRGCATEDLGLYSRFVSVADAQYGDKLSSSIYYIFL